jgi:uncharacterized glyoxalase superfamily protein PhnB
MSDFKTLIQPWLSVTNSFKAGIFYKQAFGAIETYHLETPRGRIGFKTFC